MKRAGKIAGIIGAVIVIVVVAIGVLAKFLITPERVKKTVLPVAEKALHRPIRLEAIEVSIFSGIVLNQLTVMEKTGDIPFVKAERVRLRYKFWPLFAGRVVVDEVSIGSPRISVVRMPDGSFNYSDIVAKKEERPAEAKPERGEIHLVISKVAVTDGEVRFEDRAGARTPPPVYTLSAIDVSSHDVSMNKPFPFKAKAKFAEVGLVVDGKAADVAAKPTIDGEVRITAADLGKTAAALPPHLGEKLRRLNPSGKMTARLRMAGSVAAPKELLKEGEVRLDDVQVSVSGQRPALAGDIAIKGSTAESRNLTLAAGNNKVKIAFTASNLLAKPISIASTVSADRFDLDPFLKKGTVPAGAGPGAGPGATAPEPGPLKLPVRANGTIQLGQTAYKGLPITRFVVNYRLADNVLHVEELKGNVAGGSFSGTAQVDLGRQGFVYDTHVAVQGVQANPVVSAFAPKATGTVFGTLSLNAALNGRGTKTAAIRQNLGGQGDFALTDGRITGAGLVEGLARFINIEQLRVLQFSKFAGTFRIDKGKVVLDSAVAGKDVQITPKGIVGLDRSLNLSLVTRLSPELTGKVARGNIGSFVTDEKGWGLLPLKVTGTTSSPSFRVDASAVREQLKGKAKEKLQQTIEEKLLKKKPGESPRPEQELLEKGLKGIFGK